MQIKPKENKMESSTFVWAQLSYYTLQVYWQIFIGPTYCLSFIFFGGGVNSQVHHLFLMT